MKARIELQISSETDLSIRDIVDLMHDALDNSHGIKITGIVVDKNEPKEQVLTETKTQPKQPALAPDGKPLKYGPGTVIVDDGQGQPDSVEQFPPNNNLKPVPVNRKEIDKAAGKGPWSFGTKWG